MPARNLPNIGLTGGFLPGESGWGDAMSLNLLTLSVLAQATALDKVAATPGSPAVGDIYLFDETHPTQANKVAVYDGAALDEEWTYITPHDGWLIFNQAAGYYEQFDGTVWAEFAAGGGGGSSLPPGGDTGQVLTKVSGADGDADWADPAGGGTAPTESIIVALGDETTVITVGVAKVTMRMPYAFTLTGVKASLTTASSSGNPTVDINEGGASILSTKLTIDSGEKTSATAATPAVISDGALADDAEITFDIDVAGTDAAGLKVVLIGHQ